MSSSRFSVWIAITVLMFQFFAVIDSVPFVQKLAEIESVTGSNFSSTTFSWNLE